MIYCPNCSINNPKENKFCFNCGVKLPEIANYCQYCDITYDNHEKFCINCGNPLIIKPKSNDADYYNNKIIELKETLKTYETQLSNSKGEYEEIENRFMIIRIKEEIKENTNKYNNALIEIEKEKENEALLKERAFIYKKLYVELTDEDIKLLQKITPPEIIKKPNSLKKDIIMYFQVKYSYDGIKKLIKQSKQEEEDLIKSGYKKCPNCGKILIFDATRCHKCRYEFDD